jgi:hypothetical protein
MKKFVEWAKENKLLELQEPDLDDDLKNPNDQGFDESPKCSECGGQLKRLGMMGCKMHYRCRNCGVPSFESTGTCGD